MDHKTTQKIEVQNNYHLPMGSGLIDEIGPVEEIDRQLGTQLGFIRSRRAAKRLG